jgi:hypothetical protein
MIMVVRIERTEDLESWDELVYRAGGSPFHSTGFMEPFRINDVEPVYLLFRDENEIIGGSSAVVSYPRQRIIRKMKVYKSAIFYSGPFFLKECSNSEANESLIRYLRDEGMVKFNYIGYDLACHPDIDREGFEPMNKDEWVIELGKDADSFKTGLRRRIRSKVNRANREGLEFDISNDPDHSETLYDLLDETARFRAMRDLDEFRKEYVPYLNMNVIREQVARGGGRFAVVSRGEEVLSIMYFISNRRRSFCCFIGTCDEGYRLGANAKVFHDLALHLISEGVELYNLGGTRDGPGKQGLILFKRGFGATEAETYTMVSPFLKGKILELVSDANRIIKGRVKTG